MPGEVDLIEWPRDIDRSKRASALDTVIRHREVARPYVRVLARRARINRWPRGRSAPKEFKTSRVMVLGVSEHLIGWWHLGRVGGLPPTPLVIFVDYSWQQIGRPLWAYVVARIFSAHKRIDILGGAT